MLVIRKGASNPMPRVMNVDKNPAYPAAMEALKDRWHHSPSGRFAPVQVSQ
jgi:transposase-like protein